MMYERQKGTKEYRSEREKVPRQGLWELPVLVEAGGAVIFDSSATGRDLKVEVTVCETLKMS